MPLLIFVLFLLHFLVSFCTTGCKKDKLYKLKRNAIKERMFRLVNIIVFLMYPGLSVKIFSIFKCTPVDSGEYYLANDMSIRCYQGIHIFYSTIASACIFVYVIGIPMISFIILFRNRKIIQSTSDSMIEQQELLTKEIGSLYGQYETRFYYWECIEMIKKMMLTGGLVLLAPGSSAQILLGILITLVYLCLVLKFEPYNEDEDDFLQFVATITILLTLISGLALRSDDVNKGYYESHLMASLLILINCSIFVAFVYTFYKSTESVQAILYKKMCSCCIKKETKKNDAKIYPTNNVKEDNLSIPPPPKSPPPNKQKKINEVRSSVFID